MTTALLFAGVWGGLWALFLQWHPWGQWLAIKRTWLTVVIGVGVDLAILLLVLEWSAWTSVAGVIAVSGIGVIVRSLYNEHHEDIA